ncbi:MAG: acyltransferase [Sulfurimonas sp.]|nr:acyltransferase [Sulfurimonas sp.]
MKSILRKVYVLYLRKALGSIGDNSWISPFGTYLNKKKIEIGNRVYIGKGAFLSASDGIIVGSGVAIGPEFMVMGGDHKFDVVGKRLHELTAGGDNRKIVIEDDVWIGARVTLLKGAKIGEGAIVGACSLVTKDIPPYTIYAGNPAKRIGFRFTKEGLQQHLSLVKSKHTFEHLSNLYE